MPAPILPENIKRTKSGTKYLPAVDLHDHKFKEAKNVVIETIKESYSAGVRRVRFITGKGNHVNSNGERAVIFNAFPSWLLEDSIKNLVKFHARFDGSYVVTLQQSKKSRKASVLLDDNIAQQEAKNDDIDAQFILGLMYLNGNNSKSKDVRKALKWLRKSAEKGDISSQLIIGNLFYEGNGVEKDLQESFKWFKMAAEKGNSDAQFILGRMYFEGDGVEKNINESIKWFKQSANVNAQLFVGNLLYEGNGVNKNHKEAFNLFKSAAKQGNVSAQIMVSKMYSNGQGILKKSHKKAFKWIKRAAQQDNPDAQFILGKMYAKGKGTQKDIDEALGWFKKAADKGHPESRIITEAF